MTNLFEAAHRILRKTAVSGAGNVPVERELSRSPDGEEKASVLLARLGYHTPAEPVERANRLALLALASKFERVLELPLPHGPGAAFFGAMVSPAALGIDGHDPEPVGVAGRGIDFRQAFESCVGEAAEFLSFIERTDDPRLTEPKTRGTGADVPDLEDLLWALNGAGLAPDADLDGIGWISASSLLDGRRIHFPVDIVLRRPPARRKGSRKAESTGLSAGRTLEDAIYSGLMEVVERDAVSLWWYGGLPARVIGETTRKGVGFDAFAETVRGGSDRRVRLLEITTDIQIPAVVSFSREPDGSAVIAGFAADCDIATAMQRAFLEMCQMELAQRISLEKLARHGERGLKDKDRDWIRRYRELSVDEFPTRFAPALEAVPRSAFSGDKSSFAIERLAQSGFTPVYVDLTVADVGIPVVKAMVPQLQSSSPDWLTKRLSDTALENKSPLDQQISRVSPI